LKKETLSLNASSFSLIVRLWRDWMSQHLSQIILAFVLMLLFAAFTATFPLLIEKSVELLEEQNPNFFYMPLLIMIVAIVRGLVSYVQTIVSQSVALRIINQIQKAMFGHLMDSDIPSFQAVTSGELMSRFTNDVNMMRDTLSKTLVGLLRNVIVAIFLIGVMFYLDWLLAAIILALLPIAGRPVIRIGRRVRRVATKVQEEMGFLTANLEQSLAGIRLIKSYGMENSEQIRANKLFENIYYQALKLVKGRSRTYPILETVGGISIAAIIAYGGWRIISGTGTLESFVGFLTAVITAYRPIRSLGPLLTSLQEGLSAIQRSFSLLDKKPAIKDVDDAGVLLKCEGSIKFENVFFSYNKSTPALENISFTIRKGQKVALVGPSGAGKSTILNMVLRFYDPDNGRITIDKKDIREVTMASLRSNIALVSQDVFLFDSSVAKNIQFGRPAASQEEIIAAARAAGADEFIEVLPDTYDTIVGERGVKLSGGQQQRISIARAILRKAPILLLDEATSSLDLESEQNIQNALDKLTENKTTIVIAHRLATIMKSDIIYFIDNGQIVESGRHEDLISMNGSYARLCNLQFKDEALNEAE
jgi:subfamily B ATP-binding cassette protein MsbA|tara:strand:- start:15934 stop:17709 length:1776 start_codon:yes stop_codon:yes gene_type:complete